MLGVEDVSARCQGRLIVLNPLGLNAADAGLQGPARIGDHILQGIPSLQRLGPSRARQGGGFLAQEPDHAVRLDAHQDGAAVEEDLIEASHQDQGLALGIEPFEDPAGRFASSLDPALDRGPSRSLLGSQHHDQQIADLIETEPHGPAQGGELLLLDLRKLNGSVEPFPKLSILTAEGFDFSDQWLAWRVTRVLGLDGGVDLAGLIVGWSDGRQSARRCLRGNGRHECR